MPDDLARPVLLIDEVSFGLAPIVCERIRAARSVVNSTSIAMLVAEQHIHYAESVTDRALVMNEGAIRAEMTSTGSCARGRREHPIWVLSTRCSTVRRRRPSDELTNLRLGEHVTELWQFVGGAGREVAPTP